MIAVAQVQRGNKPSRSYVVAVAKPNILIQLQMEPVLNQIHALTEKKRYDEIFSLCTLLDLDKAEHLHEYQKIHSQCGFDWFSDSLFLTDAKGNKISWKKKYEKAVLHFMKAKEDYRHILALFPKLHTHLQRLSTTERDTESRMKQGVRKWLELRG
jgi:ABC-type uncharacterized transport system substrate-binding protein